MIEKTTYQTPSARLPYIIMALIVFICSCLLLYLDKDVKKFSNLFTPGILIVSSYYSIPTFAVCYFLFRNLMKTHDKSLSLFISLILGIPLGFVLVITFFNLIM